VAWKSTSGGESLVALDALVCVSYFGSGEHPDEEDNNGEDGCSKEIPGPEGRRRFLDELIRQARQLEAADVVDVAVSDLGRCVLLVFVDDGGNLPPGYLAHDADDTTRPVLAVVAVDK